jgi:serine/threonine protein phosphatase PrpC
LFLACDGIFEKMSSDTVKNFIFTQYKTKADLTSILCDLLDLSLDAGSQDNMTALLVYLGENGENYTIAESERILPGPFFPQCSQESFAKQYVSNLFSIYDGKIPSSAIKAMCEASKKSLHQKILKLNQELEDIRKDAEIQKQFLFEQIEKGFPEGATKPEGRIFSRPRVDSRTIIKFESPTFKAASMFVPLDKLSPVEFVVSETKHGYCIALIEGNLPEEGEVHLSSSFVASTLTSEIDKLPTLTKESLASSVEKIDQALKRQIIGDQPSDNKNSSSRTPSGVPNCFIQDFCSMSFAVISKLNSEEEPKQFPLICGHVGFTHCLLGKGSKVGNVHLLVNTKTHSPFDNEERDRLIQSGVEPKIFRQAFTGEVLPARRLGISRQQGVIPKPTVTDNVHAEPGDFLLFLTGSLELGPIERLTEFIQQRLVVRKGDLEATLEDALYYATQRTSRFYSSFSIMIFQILPQSQSPPSNLQIQKIYRPGPIFFLEGSPELKKVYVQHAELHGRKLDMDLMKEGYLADIRNIEREVETAAELTAQKIDEINANIQRIENGECEKTFHFWLEQLTKK